MCDESSATVQRSVKETTDHFPKYDTARSYAWNYEQAPLSFPTVRVPPCQGSWTFCGLPTGSPLGIPAGPLLNGKWALYYASLGFDVLTYKTVRSSRRGSYPLPNLVPVDVSRMTGEEPSVPETSENNGTWAVSFGMPSADPDVWQRDIEWTRGQLPPGKCLSVSVVGTVQPDGTIEQLAEDYAWCAKAATQSGAHCIEANFSCPNVSTYDGQIFQQPHSAQIVVEKIREAIGRTPLIIKVGHITREADAEKLLDAVGAFINGIAMTNSVAARVKAKDGRLLFDGQPRGICGKATLETSLQQVAMFQRLLKKRSEKIDLIGVGGADCFEDVQRYLAVGAQAVHIATAAMLNPLVGIEIRQSLAASTLPEFSRH